LTHKLQHENDNATTILLKKWRARRVGGRSV